MRNAESQALATIQHLVPDRLSETLLRATSTVSTTSRTSTAPHIIREKRPHARRLPHNRMPHQSIGIALECGLSPLDKVLGEAIEVGETLFAWERWEDACSMVGGECFVERLEVVVSTTYNVRSCGRGLHAVNRVGHEVVNGLNGEYHGGDMNG